MEVTSSDPPATGILDFYSFIKSGFFQLINLINLIFLKLFGVTPEEIDDKSTVISPKADKKLKDESSTKEVGLQKNSKKVLKKMSKIPGPLALPWVGTLFTSSAISDNDLMRANEERFKKYGPVVKEELRWNFPMIIVLGPDEAETAIRTMGASIGRPGVEIITTYRATRPERYDPYSLVNGQGEHWEVVKKAFVPLISSPSYVLSMMKCSDKMAKDLCSIIDTSTYIPLQDLFGKFVTESSFYNIFGKRMGCIAEDDKMPQKLRLFMQVHDAFFKAFHDSLYGYPWWKIFKTPLWNNFVESELKMNELIEEVIEEAMKDPKPAGIFKEVIDMKDLSENTKRVIILELITGATDPVLCTGLLMIYWLAQDKTIQQKIFEELKEILPSQDTPIDEHALNRMTYLKACITESYRICPATPNFCRFTDSPMELGGYSIPAGTLVMIQTWFTMMQDDVFYRPKEYIPERWLYENNVPRYKPHRRNIMITFGTGRRLCPGRRAATQHLTVLMATLFRKYEIHFENELKVKYEWLVTPQGTKVKFYERKD